MPCWLPTQVDAPPTPSSRLVNRFARNCRRRISRDQQTWARRSPHACMRLAVGALACTDVVPELTLSTSGRTSARSGIACASAPFYEALAQLTWRVGRKLDAKFITLEGIDGSGKSHLLRQYSASLAAGSDPSIVAVPKDFAYEEHSKWQGARLAASHRLAWGYEPDEPVWKYSQQYWLLALASWYQLFFDCMILPELEAGRTVVTDGWYYKHQARFQLSGDADFISLVAVVLSKLPQPDLVLVLDEPIELVTRRKTSSKPTERGAFEKAGVEVGDPDRNFADYQQRTRDRLLATTLAMGSRSRRIRAEVAQLADAVRDLRGGASGLTGSLPPSSLG